MDVFAVFRRLDTIMETVVAHDGGDAQTIVAEDPASSGCLGFAMAAHVPPSNDGRLVAKERERKHLFRVGQTLETLDGDEPIDLLEDRFQRSRRCQIVVAAARRRLDLEQAPARPRR